jgi:hypothetical protein
LTCCTHALASSRAGAGVGGWNSRMPPATAAAHDFGRTCCCRMLGLQDLGFRVQGLGLT